MWEKLVDAIEHKQVVKTKEMLRQSPEQVVAKNYQDETLLHFAAKAGSPEIVADLLVRGAKPDIPDEFGWTPLHEACGQGHDEVVALFLKLPFNLDGTSKQRETALHLAIRHGYARIVARLLKAGANTELRNQAGNTPLQIAALAGLVEIMKLLGENGADISARNLAGETALHCAAREGRIEAAEWCLAHGAKPDELDKGDRTFIDVALREGRMNFIGYFASLENPIATQNEPNPLTATGIRLAVATEARDMASQAITLNGKLANAFFFGTGRKLGKRFFFPLLDAALWFLAFPFAVFLLWAGFAQGAIPDLVVLPLHLAPATTDLIEALLNTFLIFLGSHFLVSTPKDADTYDQAFLNLRPSVKIRILHFVLIDAIFFRNLEFNRSFWENFGLFWLWFLLLYGFAFLSWWIRSGSKIPSQADDRGTSGDPRKEG